MTVNSIQSMPSRQPIKTGSCLLAQEIIVGRLLYNCVFCVEKITFLSSDWWRTITLSFQSLAAGKLSSVCVSASLRLTICFPRQVNIRYFQ